MAAKEQFPPIKGSLFINLENSSHSWSSADWRRRELRPFPSTNKSQTSINFGQFEDCSRTSFDTPRFNFGQKSKFWSKKKRNFRQKILVSWTFRLAIAVWHTRTYKIFVTKNNVAKTKLDLFWFWPAEKFMLRFTKFLSF